MTDTSRTIEISKSSTDCVVAVLMGIVFLYGSLEFANGSLVDASMRGPWAIPFGWFSLAFSSLCLIVILKHLLLVPAKIARLSPTGLRDLRMSPDEIPWHAIQNVCEYNRRHYRGIAVQIDRDALADMKWTWRFRLFRKPNAWMGADGLWITAPRPQTDFDRLFSNTLAYARAHGPCMQSTKPDTDTRSLPDATKSVLPGGKVL